MNGVALLTSWLLVMTATGTQQRDPEPRAAVRLIEASEALNIELMREQFEAGLEQSAGPLPAHVKDKVWQEFRAAFPREEAAERLAAIYEELFSEEDIEGLVAFYETPLGENLVRVQHDLIIQTMVAVQEISARTGQQVGSKLVYYLEGETLRAAGQLDRAIESLRRAVTLYPDDPEFRESLGRTLAAAGRLDEARVELDELSRLRPGTVIDPSVLPFVGLWQFESDFVWIEILENGGAFQCRIGPDDTVYTSEGVVRAGSIEWEETWGTETIARTEAGLAVGGDDDNPGETFAVASGLMDEACHQSSGGDGDAPPSSRAAVMKPVSFEPEFKRTFGPQIEIPRGTVFHVRVIEKAGNEAIRVHRCGVPCNTATMVKIWSPDDYAAADELRWAADEDGKYYLWVQNVSEDSVVAGVFEEIVNERTRIILESGAVFEVWYETP